MQIAFHFSRFTQILGSLGYNRREDGGSAPKLRHEVEASFLPTFVGVGDHNESIAMDVIPRSMKDSTLVRNRRTLSNYSPYRFNIFYTCRLADYGNILLFISTYYEGLRLAPTAT